ncbi:MAG: MlaD family protein [Pseudomonadota bacterium]
MENRAHALMAGLFLLLFGLALAAAALWLGQRGIDRATYNIVTPFTVSGLNLQAPVKYRGVQIGQVEAIDFDPKNPALIVIRVTVDKSAPIKRDTYAQLSYQGVTGLAYVELADSGQPSPPLQTSEREPATIPMRQSLLAEVGSSGQMLLMQLNELMGKLNKLGSEENQAHVSRILANVATSTAEIVQMQQQLEPTLQRLPGLLASAERALGNTNVLVQDLDRLTLAAQQELKNVGKAGDSVAAMGQAGEQISREISSTTLPELHALMNSLTRTSESFDRLATQLQQRPQSLVFGKSRAAPGPGERGFTPPTAEEVKP